MRLAWEKRRSFLGIRGLAAVLFLLLLLASGCATGGKYMTNAEPIVSPPEGKALVTFVRPSNFGGAISFGLWDGDIFIGILGPDMSIQYETAPGEHYFIARAENWACVKADLVANRQYVIKANPVIGAWKARVVLSPVNESDYNKPGELPKVRKWLADAKPMMPNPEHRDAYAEPRRQDVLKAKEMFVSGEGKYLTLGAGDYLPE